MLVLAGCVTAEPPNTPVTMPGAAGQQGQTQLSAAAQGAAAAFANPSQLQGQPGRAAIAVAQLEYITAEFGRGMQASSSGDVLPSLEAARQEVRNYLRIGQTVPSQTVINAMTAAASGGPSQFPAGLAEGGGTALWQRLGSMPRMPQANAATQQAVQYLEFGAMPGGQSGGYRR